MPARRGRDKLVTVSVENSCEEFHCKEKERNGVVARGGSSTKESFFKQLY